MKFKKTISAIAAAAVIVSAAAAPVMAETEETPVYLDTTRTFEERAADLVSRMTLEEKVAQLGYQAPAIERLGVSKYNYWMECLHGVARQGKATNYPASLSLSNTWNRELIRTIADETSTEARVKNNRYNLSYYTPTINMARDPRWGRNEETYGEDPYLTGQLGAEFVKGMQGDDPKYTKIIATIKHFAANNNEKNRRGGSSYMTEFNFRNYYTKVFQNLTEQVMPGSVMSSYNATSISRNGSWIYNFVPSSANKYMLTDLLRRNWGFDGYVTTDCGAGNDLASVSQYKQGIRLAEGEEDENAGAEFYVASAIKNGMDLECNLSGGNTSTAYGEAAVRNGYMTEEQLETAVYHLFLQRFRTGEFDDAASYRSYTKENDLESDAHIQTAQKAAEESWVLLKNDDNTLPLNSVESAAVVGDLADKLVLGDYTGTPENTVTPIEGIRSALGEKNIDVTHVGAVSDDTPLFNVKSISLVKSNGTETKLNLADAEGVSGMNDDFTNVTPKAAAYIPSVNFENVTSVKVEMETGSMWGGSLNIAYGQGGTTVAAISSPASGTSGYTVCSGDYTGADGGYNGVSDMYISASAAIRDFSVSEFKSELDSADVIIAYAGTIPKQAGFGDADSSESHDRDSINLPAHQAHVQAICDAYPDKTIVVMSTVGQINVEPFMNKCKAILWTSYNGQVQGTSLGRVLSGEVNPSGRLTTTWYAGSDVQKMELANTSDTTIGDIKGKFTNYNIQPDGSKPGNTYMYYNGTPVYPFGYGLSYTDFAYSDMQLDKTAADANETVTASVKVRNTGTVKGSEVVQLYISHPENSGFGANTPKKQLKGFEKVTLEPDEEKTVTFTVDINDLSLYDETAQKDIVPEGEYTIYIGKNATDTANSAKLTVSGKMASVLKTVKAMPDGITVYGLIETNGTGLESKTKIDPSVSAVMSDEEVRDGFEVTLTSSDTEVAKIENGRVVSGTKEGTALITASVTIDGTTKTDSFPVVNSLAIKPSSAEREAAKAAINAAFSEYPEAAYSAENYNELKGIRDAYLSQADAAESVDDLSGLVDEAGAAFKNVSLDALEETYTIVSENKNILLNGVIDYRTNGIPPYSGASGTITNKAPYTAKLLVNGADAAGDIIWQIKKLDASDRQVADIDSATGELTIYGNGVVEITAADITNLRCARQTVYINTQIEGEYADSSGGANLADAQRNTSNGLDVGSSGKYWIEYKGVKLSMLEEITARYSLKTGNAVINVSLDQSTAAGKLIATAGVDATGAWNTWADKTLNINTDAIEKATLDEYGCATVYIQTNGANLDYFRLIHTEYNDETPYEIVNATNKKDGKINVSLKYRGSVAATDVKLVAEVLRGDESVKSTSDVTVNGSGEYEISTAASDGETVKLTVKNNGEALSESVNKVYRTPAESTIAAYYRDSDDGNNYSLLLGGDAGVQYGTVNGLSGYGTLNDSVRSGSYTYTDFNGKTYAYSFRNVWKVSGKGGSTSKENLFFTPASECKVTVVFDGNGGGSARTVTIYQSESKTVTASAQDGNGKGDTSVSLDNITDTTAPVYVYATGGQANICMIIVEYYGKSEEPPAPPEPETELVTVEYDPSLRQVTLTQNNSQVSAADVIMVSYDGDAPSAVKRYKDVVFANGEAELNNVTLANGDRLYVWDSENGMKPLAEVFTYNAENTDVEIQSVDWNGNDIRLLSNDYTGVTRLVNITSGGAAELGINQFYSAPEGLATSYSENYFTVNAIDTYKSRLFAGCDSGYVMMLTDCAKCYQLKKPVDFDIKYMSISDGVMTVSDGENTREIGMAELGADEIKAEDAELLINSNKAVLIDLRDETDYNAEHFEPSVNVQPENLAAALEEYNTNQIIIFACYSGGRASRAIEAAKELGFENTYNLGSIDNILN